MVNHWRQYRQAEMPQCGEPQHGPWAAVSQGKDCTSQGAGRLAKKF